MNNKKEYSKGFETERTVREAKNQADFNIPNVSTVWFIGGHPGFVKKMKQKHSNWHYVCPDERSAQAAFKAGNTKASCIIVCGQYISHKMFDVFMDFRPEQCPVLYCNSLNESRMMTELKEEWERNGCPKLG